jgi:splicing factor 3B subunit 1
LVGRIADRGPEYVSAREWMRICFELLELLKAHKKAIRRATVNTFGYIAKAIGETEIVMVIMYTIIFYFSTTNFRPTRCIGYTA